jgi:hypothetical protein
MGRLFVLSVAAAIAVLFGLSNAQAQSVNGVDFVVYVGGGVIIGDPGTVTSSSNGTISATCTSNGYSVGDYRTVHYRFSLGPTTPHPTFDAISFLTLGQVNRVFAVSPSTSLNTSPSTASVEWSGISGGAGQFTDTSNPTTTTVAINAGTGGALSTTFPFNYHARIIGTFNNFEDTIGCNVFFRASVVWKQP